MNILATDTSSQALTVAIRTDSYFESRTSEGRSLQHSEKLMVTVHYGKTCKSSSVISLRGSLGAGKTVFAKGVARSLGIEEDCLRGLDIRDEDASFIP